MSKRLLPLSGIVFVALAVAAIVVLGGSTPSVTDSPAKITAFYTAHYGKQSAAPFVLAAAGAFFALFGASLWQNLTETEEGPLVRLAGAVVLIGTAVATAGYLLAATVHLALAEAIHHGVGPAGAQALNALDTADFQLFSIGTAIMLLGAAGLMVSRPGTLRWLGWIALILAIASLTPVGFFAFIGANLWIIVVSIILARSATSATDAVHSPTATAPATGNAL